MNVLAADPILVRRQEIQAIAARTLRRRKLRSRAVFVLCLFCLVVTLIPLVLIFGYVIAKGVGAWSVDFFTQVSYPAGIPGGGIYNAIIGSLIIDGCAAAVAIPLGIVIGMYMSESDGRFAASVRFAADVMAGVPAIALGIFAYGLLVVTLGHFSAVAASFALAVLMLPIVMRSSETAIRSVPRSYVEAGLSLGGRRGSIARRVVLPAALPGIITGIMLAIGRAAGETAPLLFTAIGNQYLQTSPFKPMAALPLVVYLDGIQAYPGLQQIAWGTALFLLVVILLLNITLRGLAARLQRRRL